MNLQLINISYPEVFKKYSKKYNIYRSFYEAGVLALELRGLTQQTGEMIYKILIEKKEPCFRSGGSNSGTDLLVFGTFEKFREIGKEVHSKGNEDIGYKISTLVRNYLEYDHLKLNIRNRTFAMCDVTVMGILNVTPDSFSDGGKYFDKESAVLHAFKMIEEGADIIDIGGESTRPGSEPVSLQEEIDRVIPVIIEILKKSPDTIISIDTTKAEVARQALQYGASIVNDISSGSFDVKMIETVREFEVPYMIMHMKGIPKTMQVEPVYENVISDIYDYLNQKLLELKKAGIKTFIIDPGIGFGKRIDDNYQIIKRLDEFKGLGFPIMIGVSRKSFLGKSLNLDVEDRDTASIIAETLSVLKGGSIIRTHNVKNAVQIKNVIKNIYSLENIK